MVEFIIEMDSPPVKKLKCTGNEQLNDNIMIISGYIVAQLNELTMDLIYINE